MVRIVRRRRIAPATAISLGVAMAASIVLPVLWHLRKEGEVPLQPIRVLGDVEVQWKCESGHTFAAAGQADARACVVCGERAYPMTFFDCPVHGRFEVGVRFVEDDSGLPKIAQIRLVGREWASAEAGLQCPRCSRRLVYQRDPLPGHRSTPKKGG